MLLLVSTEDLSQHLLEMCPWSSHYFAKFNSQMKCFRQKSIRKHFCSLLKCNNKVVCAVQTKQKPAWTLRHINDEKGHSFQAVREPDQGHVSAQSTYPTKNIQVNPLPYSLEQIWGLGSKYSSDHTMAQMRAKQLSLVPRAKLQIRQAAQKELNTPDAALFFPLFSTFIPLNASI